MNRKNEGRRDREVREALAEFKKCWEHGDSPSTVSFLERFPHLKGNRSFVVDLSYEEYCQRSVSDESLDVDSFCASLPAFHQSVKRQIQIHQAIQDNGLVPPTVAWPALGTTVRGFHLLEELGRGAFARVYLAREIELGNRLVTVKVSFLGTEEAETLGKLEHSSIVPIHAVQTDASGLTLICMPYRGRTTLWDVIEGTFHSSGIPKSEQDIEVVSISRRDETPSVTTGDIAWEDASYVDAVIHFGTQLAEALSHAHSKGICHRDVKPSNILLCRDGTAMLIDFNLSTDQQANYSVLGGTLPYLAPEQMAAIAGVKTDFASDDATHSDIYSLGAVLYETLCGQLPFQEANWNDPPDRIAKRLLDAQRHGPSLLHHRYRHIDSKLSQVICDCLSFDPTGRPESAAELANRLRNCAHFHGRFRRSLRKQRKTVLAAASSLLAMILLAAYVWSISIPHHQVQFQRGVTDFRSGDFTAAIEHFDSAIQHGPSRYEVVFARGRAYQKLNEFEFALKDYREAAKHRDSPVLVACQANCYVRLKNFELAVKYFQRVLDLGHRNEVIYNNLGYCYSKLRDPRLKQALDCYDRAIQQNPDLSILYYNRANVKLQISLLGDQDLFADACHDMEHAIRIGPRHGKLYALAARLYGFASRTDPSFCDKALEHLTASARAGYRAHPNDTAFNTLREHPRFRAWLEMRIQQSTSSFDRLLDPASGPTE